VTSEILSQASSSLHEAWELLESKARDILYLPFSLDVVSSLGRHKINL
jgi:hypothetical protein